MLFEQWMMKKSKYGPQAKGLDRVVAAIGEVVNEMAHVSTENTIKHY